MASKLELWEGDGYGFERVSESILRTTKQLSILPLMAN